MTAAEERGEDSSLVLTILGASPAPVNPNGAGSGYLVSAGAVNVLLDCGPGVIGRLRATYPIEHLRAVVISHLHQDHCIDLVSLRYGVKYGNWRKGPKLPVILPPGGRRFLAQLGRALDRNPGFFEHELGLEEYAPTQTISLDEMAITPLPVKHYIPSHALVVQAAGRRMTFSADAAPCQELVTAARGADLFLCEASLESAAEDAAQPSKRGHMAGGEAGAIARQAQVGELVLTHYPSDRGRSRLADARKAFGPRVRLAREGQRLLV